MTPPFQQVLCQPNIVLSFLQEPIEETSGTSIKFIKLFQLQHVYFRRLLDQVVIVRSPGDGRSRKEEEGSVEIVRTRGGGVFRWFGRGYRHSFLDLGFFEIGILGGESLQPLSKEC